MQPRMLPILLFTLLVVLPFTKPDLGSDRSALLALRLAVGGRTLLWNVTESSPCFWAGVKCEDNRVAALRLPGVALSGQLPTGIFGNLTRLRTLSMRLNALTGQVPSDLASCVNLRNLYLQGNLFSGEIPDFLFTLRDLVRLNLANNNFSGGIPLSFNNLTRLKTLFLENNQLTGSIPSAFDIPKLEQFNVSNNLLNGSVPQKLQTFKQDSFLGNSLCGQPFVACSSSFQNVTLPAENNGGKKKKLSGGAIAGIAIGSVLAFLLILVILIVVCRKKSSSKKTSAVDIATAKHSEVEIPGEKPVGEVENGRYGNGYSVAAAAVAAMTGNAKAAEANGNGGGVKKLVFFQSCPDIDQWILFLSRKDIKELVLELGESEWIRVPSCLFNCKKLIRLELFRCELDPPPTFKGFLYLKTLNLYQVFDDSDAIESLISSCPLLENLSLSYSDSLTLNIRAPNLKYLCLEGEFKDIRLENTPLLVAMSVAMYMTEDIAEHMGQSSGCNFIKLLGGVPHLERLIGHIYFTKYLSIGGVPGRLPITYSHLKIIELCQVSFEDMKEILVVLRLITNSQNLKELRISGSSNTHAANVATDLDFWEKECPSHCIFERLKVVKMTEMSGVPHEMEFIKFLLENSPVLEIMSITPCQFLMEGRLNMLIELVKFRRASAQAEILFSQG